VRRVDGTNRQRFLITALLISLMGILFVLIGGINSVHPLPGKPLPNPFADVGAATGENPGGPAWGAGAVRVFIQSLLALGAGLTLVVLIISSKHRKQFAVIFVVLLLVALILAQVKHIPHMEQAPPPNSAASSDIGAPPPVEQVHVDVPNANPTNWQVIAIAIGSSLILTGLAFLFFLKIYPLIKARSEGEDLLGALGKSAGMAAHRLVTGDDPRSAILRCYQEMTEIMSQAERIPNYSYFTPREFAAHLRQQGMKDDDVQRLTLIFEAVRYGARSGEEFVDEAIVCLRSIQRSYTKVREEG
jgi:hypothetical protein